MEGVAFGTSAVLAAIFLVSGAAKIGGGSLASDLAAYRLLPRAAVGPVASALPWIEVTVGTSILVGFAVTAMFTAAAVLLAAFTIGMAVNLVRGRVIDCGCRGAGTPISWRLVGTNVVLLVAVVLALGSWPAPVLPTLIGSEERLSVDDAVAVLVILAGSVLLVRLAKVARKLMASLRVVEALEASAQAGVR